MPRRPARKKTTRISRKATVAIHRGSVQVVVEDVELRDVPSVLRTVLGGLRRMAESFDELVPDLQPVPGGSATYVGDDGDWEGRKPARRVGF